MATLFTKIIEGELPARFVWKDDDSVVFLSINPLAPGHSLVVPRAEVDHWLDLDVELTDHLMHVARAIGHAVRHVFRPEKVGLMIAGLEVPHVHIHVSQLNNPYDLDFARAATDPNPAELDTAASAIRDALRLLGYAQVSD